MHGKDAYNYALTFVSSDSKGLVAEAAKVFFENGFNIADSSSTLLHGIFSMIFIVTSPKDHSEEQIRLMFKGSKTVPHVLKYSYSPQEKSGEHYSVSVYGADKAGIVYETAAVLAGSGVNIIDLQTSITGKHALKVYIMIFEVTVQENADQLTWQTDLMKIAKKIGTEVSIKKIEFNEL